MLLFNIFYFCAQWIVSIFDIIIKLYKATFFTYVYRISFYLPKLTSLNKIIQNNFWCTNPVGSKVHFHCWSKWTHMFWQEIRNEIWVTYFFVELVFVVRANVSPCYVDYERILKIIRETRKQIVIKSARALRSKPLLESCSVFHLYLCWLTGVYLKVGPIIVTQHPAQFCKLLRARVFAKYD